MFVNRFINILVLMLGLFFSRQSVATTYVSSASDGADWSGTALDAYQNTANNFAGSLSQQKDAWVALAAWGNGSGSGTLSGMALKVQAVATVAASVTSGSISSAWTALAGWTSPLASGLPTANSSSLSTAATAAASLTTGSVSTAWTALATWASSYNGAGNRSATGTAAKNAAVAVFSQAYSYNPSGGDTLRGRFSFTKGFSSWTSGTLTWAGSGIIDGTFVIPANGTLSLTSPLHFGSSLTLSTTGSFTVNGGTSPGSAVFLRGNNVRLYKQLSIKYCLVIDGMGHQLTVDAGGSFCAGTTPSLILRNMNLAVDNTAGTGIFISGISPILKDTVVSARGAAGATITLLDTTSSTITVSGNVRLEGFGNRIKVNGNISIDKNSTLYVGPGVTLTDVYGITMADQTSVLHLDGCDFYTGHDGSASAVTLPLSFTTGTLLIDNKVRIFNRNYGYVGAANTDMTKGFIIGGSGSSNYADVVVMSGAYLVVDGCMDYVQS